MQTGEETVQTSHCIYLQRLFLSKFELKINRAIRPCSAIRLRPWCTESSALDHFIFHCDQSL